MGGGGGGWMFFFFFNKHFFFCEHQGFGVAYLFFVCLLMLFRLDFCLLFSWLDFVLCVSADFPFCCPNFKHRLKWVGQMTLKFQFRNWGSLMFFCLGYPKVLKG